MQDFSCRRHAMPEGNMYAMHIQYEESSLSLATWAAEICQEKDVH